MTPRLRRALLGVLLAGATGLGVVDLALGQVGTGLVWLTAALMLTLELLGWIERFADRLTQPGLRRNARGLLAASDRALELLGEQGEQRPETAFNTELLTDSITAQQPPLRRLAEGTVVLTRAEAHRRFTRLAVDLLPVLEQLQADSPSTRTGAAVWALRRYTRGYRQRGPTPAGPDELAEPGARRDHRATQGEERLDRDE